MSLLSDPFGFLLDHFPKIKALLQLGQNLAGHFTGTFSAGLHLFQSFESEIEAWKNFKEDIRLKSRVVNLEKAIQKTKELLAGLFAAWRAVLDLIKNITTKIEIG